MPIQKQAINVNFGQGLDTKTDPNQVPMGKLLSLQNAIFDKGGLLQKRNGFGNLPALPVLDTNTLSTLNDSLVAIGTSIYSYSAESAQWINKGMLPQVDLNVQATSRAAANESQADSATNSNGITCSAYFAGTAAYYNIVDSATGQSIVNPTIITGTITRPRVFVLGVYFIVMYVSQTGGTFSLRYIAIPMQNPNAPHAPVTVSAQVKNGTDFYEGVVANNRLYVAFNASDGGGAIRAFFINSNLSSSAVTVLTAQNGNKISVVSDVSGPSANIWVQFYDIGTTTAKAGLYDQNFLQILAPTTVSTNAINQLNGYATGGTLTTFHERANLYPATAIPTPFVTRRTITSAGVVGSEVIILRSVGLASKAFFFADRIYMLTVYGGITQPTYFLIDQFGNIVAKLAYANGRTFLDYPAPLATVQDVSIYISYSRSDFLVPLNRTQGATVSAPFYAQAGTNVAKFEINQSSPSTAEIGSVLNITGGFLRMYDGAYPVEQGFAVFPEDITVTASTATGLLTAQTYFYQVTYEWTDAAGNLHRSAPSLPLDGTITGGDNTNTLQIPTLRLTSKPNVRIVIYRWSTVQQTYYQITDIATPLLNNTAVDTVTYVDNKSDAQILGTTILYTTGGVLENIGAPACYALTLFKSRLFLADAEDRNLIWYSKQVIEGTPVEMTDLQTIFVAPSTIASASGGPITALSAMDDKLIIFKEDAIYYLTGNGPDATGANNDFSEPTFVTSVVGCNNPKSIVFSPQGLMFQSNKGIWLLGRDLSTRYIGAGVQEFNTAVALSALTVPGTNQVRFTMDDGNILMYDYYYDQWGTFVGIPGVSSTLYSSLHTYVNDLGQVRQETPGLYLDGTIPTLLQFTTAWFKLTDLQGFQRAYFFYLLATYFTPHKLNVTIAYDYNPAFVQATMISPTNYNPPYGSDPLYGDSSPYGGPSATEQWRIFFNKQKCQAIQISIQEIYDASFGVSAGTGLTMSGLNMVIGAKKGYPTLPSAASAG